MATLAQEVELLRRRLDALEGGSVIQKRASLQLSQVSKFVSNGKRTIRGYCTTSSLDRHGDVVVPDGGKWRLPLPLLFAHDHKQPIGVVREAAATRDGVRIVAEIVEGVPQAEAVWKLIEAGALDSYSIGFLPIKGTPIPTGTRWEQWELTEISVVSVPSNRDSRIAKAKGGIPLVDMRGAVRLIRSNP